MYTAVPTVCGCKVILSKLAYTEDFACLELKSGGLMSHRFTIHVLGETPLCSGFNIGRNRNRQIHKVPNMTKVCMKSKLSTT